MLPTTALPNACSRPCSAPPADESAGVRAPEPLREEDHREALEFLAERPLHTVYMAGLIRDNGVVSASNRGVFYACRGEESARLEGVALVGHATLVEARSEDALIAFARLARGCEETHLVRVEQEQSTLFWHHYAEGCARAPRRVCRDLLLELRRPVPVCAEVPDLRPARAEDVDAVMSVNAAMALDEGGVDPFVADAEGFRRRTLRRIEQGRVWVWSVSSRLVFKADVLADTPEAVYLEGVHVRAEERGRGHGKRCLLQLGRSLLRRAGAVCLAVNERQAGARNFYTRAGFAPRGGYDTIYLRREEG